MKSIEPKEQFELFDYDETYNINIDSVSIPENQVDGLISSLENEISPEQCDLTTFWESENK